MGLRDFTHPDSMSIYTIEFLTLSNSLLVQKTSLIHGILGTYIMSMQESFTFGTEDNKRYVPISCRYFQYIGSYICSNIII